MKNKDCYVWVYSLSISVFSVSIDATDNTVIYLKFIVIFRGINSLSDTNVALSVIIHHITKDIYEKFTK